MKNPMARQPISCLRAESTSSYRVAKRFIPPHDALKTTVYQEANPTGGKRDDGYGAPFARRLI